MLNIHFHLMKMNIFNMNTWEFLDANLFRSIFFTYCKIFQEFVKRLVEY